MEEKIKDKLKYLYGRLNFLDDFDKGKKSVGE